MLYMYRLVRYMYISFDVYDCGKCTNTAALETRVSKYYINQVSERDDWQVATRKTMELLVSHASHGLVRYLVGSRASLRAPRFGGPRGPMRQCAEATFTCIGLGGRAPGTAGQRVLRP